MDLIVGTQKLHRTAEHLDRLFTGQRGKVVDVAAEAGSEAAIREHLLDGNARKSVTAYVSIMQGCNQFCTFCIVPHTRGQERSRTIRDIVAECRELAAQGVKEITLLGQIVTSYGRGLIPRRDGRTPFVQLLEAVNEINGLERIRFSSPHPKGYTDDLVEAYGRLGKLVENAQDVLDELSTPAPPPVRCSTPTPEKEATTTPPGDERQALHALAARQGVDFSLVVCSAPPERLRERIEARQALGDDPSDATVEVLALQQRVQEPLTPDERRHAVQVVNDGTLSALEAQVDRLAAAWAASQGV